MIYDLFSRNKLDLQELNKICVYTRNQGPNSQKIIFSATFGQFLKINLKHYNLMRSSRKTNFFKF